MVVSKLTALLHKYPSIKHLVIAYSGGLDSTVLLHVLATTANIKKHYSMNVIHVNHHLSVNAIQWAKHCRTYVEQLGLTYHEHNIFLQTQTSNLEAIAREKRYAIFKSYINTQTALLTGHHQNDQAETFILQLMRGAGIAGLAAMPEAMTFETGYLLRPLLRLTRAELTDYANLHDLVWIEDESNLNLCFDRNYVRHEIIPKLAHRWPKTNYLVARAAKHMAEAHQLLTEMAEADLAKIYIEETFIDIHQLTKMSIARQKNVIRFWIKQKAKLSIEEKQLDEIFNAVITSRYDATPCLKLHDWEIRRFRKQLYLIYKKNGPIDPNWFDYWDTQKDYVLPYELGILQAKYYRHFIQDKQRLKICFRTLGMKVLLKQQTQHKQLKKLMQTWSVPPWEREILPLVLLNERLISAGHYYREE